MKMWAHQGVPAFNTLLVIRNIPIGKSQDVESPQWHRTQVASRKSTTQQRARKECNVCVHSASLLPGTQSRSNFTSSSHTSLRNTGHSELILFYRWKNRDQATAWGLQATRQPAGQGLWTQGFLTSTLTSPSVSQPCVGNDVFIPPASLFLLDSFFFVFSFIIWKFH